MGRSRHPRNWRIPRFLGEVFQRKASNRQQEECRGECCSCLVFLSIWDLWFGSGIWAQEDISANRTAYRRMLRFPRAESAWRSKFHGPFISRQKHPYANAVPPQPELGRLRNERNRRTHENGISRCRCLKSTPAPVWTSELINSRKQRSLMNVG